MPRKQRTNSQTGVQHIGLKGHDSKQIFYDDDDREKFLYYLARACKKYSVAVLGFVLMSNHVHLVFEGEVENFARVFQSMGASFNRWYNAKYEHTGTIYNARYYSKLVQTRKQIVNLLVYVFRNPVAAGMIKDARDYKWSSCAETFARKQESIADIKRVDELVSIGHLEDALDAKEALEDDEMFHVFPQYKPNDDSALAKAKELVGSAALQDFAKQPEDKQQSLVEKLLKFGANIAQIARISGINRRRVEGFCLAARRC